MKKLSDEQVKYLKLFIPEGWYKAFGEQLIQELDDIIYSENIKDFEITDVKEKWLELRIYVYPYNEKVEQVIDKYTNLSHKYCLACGELRPCANHPYY